MSTSTSGRTSMASSLQDPPKPCSILEDYTPERVAKGGEYAEAWLAEKGARRNISPITQKALALYAAACNSFVLSHDCLTEEVLEKSREAIQVFEDIFQNHHYFKPIKDKEGSQWMSYIMSLRHYEYYARYGDYAAKLVSELCNTARQKGAVSCHWEKISARYSWSTIAQKLKDQQANWGEIQGVLQRESNETARKKTLRTAPPLHRTIFETCSASGLDFDQVLNSIKMYSQRNELMHSEINQILEKGDHNGLARLLHSDLGDLSKVMPEDNFVEEVFLKVVIENMIHEWFNTRGSFDRPVRWLPTDSLLEEMDKRGDNPSASEGHMSARAKDNEGLRKKLMEEARKALEKDNSDELLIDLLVDPPPWDALPDPTTLGVLPQSSRSVSEMTMEELKAQQNAWDDIIELYADTAGQYRKSVQETIQQMKAARARQKQYHRQYGPGVARPGPPTRDGSPPSTPQKVRSKKEAKSPSMGLDGLFIDEA